MVHFGHQIIDCREVEVPLQQRREYTEIFVGLVQQVPHVRNHFGAVGIDNQVFRHVAVAGDMPLGNALARQGAQEFQRVVTVVNAVDVNIIDVK